MTLVGSASAVALSLEQWAAGFLQYIGAPATRPSDARVLFLEKWATVEGTFYLGNVNNPLDTELPEPGNGLWNSAGVRTYPTLTEGYEATLATIRQGIDAPMLAALKDVKSTVASLTAALSASDWTGYGPQSADESGYAGAVSRGPVGPVGPLGSSATSSETTSSKAAPLPYSAPKPYIQPPPVRPTATIRGQVVNPSGQGIGDICISAVPNDGLGVTTVTASDGSFALVSLPERDFRIRMTDCNFVEGGLPPSYFDVSAKRGRSLFARDATLLPLSCTHSCNSERYRLPRSITYGMVTPKLGWPTPSSLTYGGVLSDQQLDAKASVRGRYVYTPARGAALLAGRRTLKVTFTPTDSTDYRIASAQVQLEVDPATPTVSWSPPSPISYGTPLSAAQLGATSSVPGTFSYAGPTRLGAVPNAGAETLDATFRPVDSNDYQSVSMSTTLNVTPATPAIIVPSDVSAKAGSALSSAQLGVHASVSGTFTYSPPLGTPVAAGTQTVSVTFTPRNSQNYMGTTATIALNGMPRSPTISWSEPRSVVVGSVLSSTQLDAHASVPGTFTYSPSAGTVLTAGTQTLTATFTPSNANAYSSATTTTAIVVTPATAPTTTPTIPTIPTNATVSSKPTNANTTTSTTEGTSLGYSTQPTTGAASGAGYSGRHHHERAVMPHSPRSSRHRGRPLD